MQLRSVDVTNEIPLEDFEKKYDELNLLVVIKIMAKHWSVYIKWNWNFLEILWAFITM